MTGGIVAALVDFQANLPKVEKGSTANVRSERGAFKYEYADLADLSAVVLPALAAVGICYTAELTSYADAGHHVLIAQLRHISGEVVTCAWPVQLGTAQAMGSAITYGRRYCLLAMTGVHPSGEDDDGAAAAIQPRAPIAQPSDRISKAQVSKLWAQMDRADLGGDEPKRQWMASVLGVDADGLSSKDLTREQFDQLLAELKALIGRGATRTAPTEPPAPDQWTVDPGTGELSIEVEQ